jgi:hypothetical protein
MVEKINNMASPAAISSSPLSSEQQVTILTQLRLILQSPSFRSSKRYPAMLEHCVRLTISGDLEGLRERQLGISLFSRPPGYDTSSDPIVRMAASEIRKRLAQFYDVAGEDTQVKISLPPGSYVAEFRFPEPTAPAAGLVSHNHEPVVQEPEPAAFPKKNTPEVGVSVAAEEDRGRRIPLAVWFLSVGILLLCSSLVYRQWSRPTLPSFWRGAGDGADGQVVLVVGQLPSGEVTGQLPGSAVVQGANPDLPLQSDIFRANRFVTLEAASSSITICSMIARVNLNCLLKPAALVDLSNVRKRPAIFLGAYSNPWTLRIAAPLPYRFGPLACKCIVEAKSSRAVGEVDFATPRDKILTDYSIIVRLHSEITDGPAWVIAGVGPMSTTAAAEFASSAKSSQDLLDLAPKGWKNGNVEAVLATDIVNGIPGHTRILRTAFW